MHIFEIGFITGCMIINVLLAWRITSTEKFVSEAMAQKFKSDDYFSDRIECLRLMNVNLDLQIQKLNREILKLKESKDA